MRIFLEMNMKLQETKTRYFVYAVGLGMVALLVAVGIYTYLGTFSRHLADDYCEAVRVTNMSPLDAVFERYSVGAWRAANRYSNLLFVGISESLSENNIPFSTVSMIIMWYFGLTWTVYELRKFLKIDWLIHFDLFWGLFFGFFSFLQAPNLFQTVYWRSSMMTHFAPLVFGLFLTAFLLKSARTPAAQPVPLWVGVVIFLSSFVIAGFSEPPTATALVALLLSLLAVGIWGKSPARKKYVILLGWAFTGVFVGLLTMIFSPAIADVKSEKGLNLIELLGTSFLYAYLFIVDSLKTQPLPSLISISVSAAMFWLYGQVNPIELTSRRKRLFLFLILAIPVLVWVLIAAGFSPSVYGQGFPVERMRFLARSLMIAGFMLEGALLGLLLQHVQFKPNPQAGQLAVLAVFTVIMVVYPLRAAVNILRYDVPEYRARAELWDLRNAYIIRHASMGEKDLVIPGFSGVYQVKEIDNDPNHWVNKCAARFYNVETIRAFNLSDEELLDYLNE